MIGVVHSLPDKVWLIMNNKKSPQLIQWLGKPQNQVLSRLAFRTSNDAVLHLPAKPEVRPVLRGHEPTLLEIMLSFQTN